MGKAPPGYQPIDRSRHRPSPLRRRRWTDRASWLTKERFSILLHLDIFLVSVPCSNLLQLSPVLNKACWISRSIDGFLASSRWATSPILRIAQALFDTGDTWVKRHLATNPSIDRDMMQALSDIVVQLAQLPQLYMQSQLAYERRIFTSSSFGYFSSISSLQRSQWRQMQAQGIRQQWVRLCCWAWGESYGVQQNSR